MTQLTEKSAEIKEYFNFKGHVNTESFLSVVNSIPAIRTIPHSGQMSIINAYEERIEPSPETRALGLDFEYKYRFLVAACGRRFGKSVIASILGAQELMIPGSKVLIVSYTLDNCSVIFESIRKIIKGLGIELTVDRNKDMELTLINQSTLRVASVDNVESRLGTAVSLLILDEAKLFHKSLYEQVLLPMTLDYYPLSRSILISSPQNGWFETYYNYGQSTESKYEKYWSINLPSSTNPTLPASYLKDMEATTPPDIYAQEYLGLFTSAAGLVCPEFTNDHIYDVEDYPFFRNWLDNGNTIFQTIDSGYSHYFASLHVMYVEEIDTYFVFNEYQLNKKVTSVHAENTHAFEAKENISVCIRYADPAASQQIADFSEYDLYYNKSDKNLRETIGCVNSLMYSRSEITGKPKLLFSRECPEIIRQLRTIQWKEGDDNQTKEKSATGVKPFCADKDKQTDWDLFDALRYGMFSYHKNNRFDASVFSFGGDEEEYDPMTKLLYQMGLVKLG